MSEGVDEIKTLLTLVDKFKKHMKATQDYICEDIVKDQNFDCPVRFVEFKIFLSTCELSEVSQQVMQKEFRKKSKKINTFLKYLSTILDSLSKEIRIYTERIKGEQKAKCEELCKKFETSIRIVIDIRSTFTSVKEIRVGRKSGKCLPIKLKKKGFGQRSRKLMSDVSQECEALQEGSYYAESIVCVGYVFAREINTSLVHLENIIQCYKTYLSA